MGTTLLTAAALGVQTIGGIAEGQAKKAEAEDQARQDEINAYIGKTRAIQTDEAARRGLESELSTMRATFASNNQRPNSATAMMMGELRTARNDERRIDVANANQVAGDYLTSANNNRKAGRRAATIGFVRAVPNMFSLIDLKKKE